MKRIILFCLMTAVAGFAETAQEWYQKALVKERSEGKLEEAMQLYRRAAEGAGIDRALAAKALMQLAACYEKLGNTESRKIYERVVREYGDQKEAVTVARSRLGGSTHMGRQTNTLVWTGAKVNGRGMVSPDGRFVTYTDWDSGDLAVHDIAAATDRRLTDTKQDKASVNVFAEGSAISPDGKQVAYLWYDSTRDKAQLWLASLNGNANARRLFDNPDVDWLRPWDWSPDGKWVVVALFRTDKTQQIGLVSIADGTMRVLKSVDWRGTGRIRFSPDGKHVGYDLPQNETGVERDVFVLSVDGAREIRSVAHPSNDTMLDWTPDGRLLLFASDRTGTLGLWGVPIADGKPQGAPELLRADFPARAESIGVTRTGTLYYAIHGSQDRFKIQVATMDFSTGKYASKPTDLTQDYLESNATPTWSPDGRQLAYKSVRGPAQKPSHEVILIRSMDSGQVRELRPKLTYFGPMAWAPDGRWFLTLGGDLQGRRGIFQVDPDTGAATTLLLDQPGERSWYPHWSRDGKSFLFKRDYRLSKESAYIERDVATGKERVVIRRRVLLNMVNPSPDDQYLVSRSVDEASNSRTLLLIPLQGGEARELLRYPAEVSREDLADSRKGAWLNLGMWAPDSRSFLAFKYRGDPQDPRSKSLGTWRIPVDGGAPQKLDDTSYRDSDVAKPAVHPDRRRVAFTVKETTPRRDPEIWALDNFLPSNTAK
ncbi:MAG: PD40 domain-containing protein [Acidobacteria bacterium]|nr:PD40 domain-containing protein [Acidobacteriota bacterium]